ncbi:MAG: Fe-S cluster assembly protein SufD [Microscillaceae bacterium]|jgi:Fe-S cluster assembly protein SufD|nr:Fe-S cluster assembly protein SufD [Microscillaceae bacterium]
MSSLNQTTDFTAALLAQFQDFEQGLNGKSQSAWHQIRRQAIQNFQQLGIPSTKHEEWKYTNLSKVFKQDYTFNSQSNLQKSDIEPLMLTGFEANVLVVVNGRFRADLSEIISPSNQLIIKTLAEVYESDHTLIEQYFAKHLNLKNEAFTALNTAFADSGLFIQVPHNQVVSHPVMIYYLNDSRTQSVAVQPRNLFVFGRSSQATIIEKYDTLGDFAGLTNLVGEVFVYENAHINHYRLQNERENAYQINTTQVQQNRDSHYNNITISLQGGLIRNNLNISLAGENIESHMLGLYMLDGKSHVDNHTIADHQQPNSMSNELYKGILADNSSGVFNGKIFVRKDAQKTNAYQQNRNVLLSDSASVNTKPQLEIWADDVKCSHGATTGSLDETAMFYLRARGIPPKEARALLVHAFAYEILEKIHIEALRAYLDEVVLTRLNQ